MVVEDLKIFKTSHSLTLDLYKLTKNFPVDERFGLISQIRRASSSICANLMEGAYKNSTKEYRQFAGISRGSAGELKYHLLLARDLHYITDEEYRSGFKTVDEIGKMLHGLVKSLEDVRH